MQKLLVGLFLLCFSVAPWAQEEEATPVEQIPGYVSLGETFVLNLSGRRKNTFLQLKADVLVRDDSAKAAVEKHIPAIRHKLILILSERNATDMKTPAKREELRLQATEEVRQLMGQLADNTDIEEVLFSSFLVQ